HELSPPLNTFRGELTAQTTAHVLPRPALDAVFLELLEAGGNFRSYASAEGRRRSNDGESMYTFRAARGEGAGDSPAYFRGDEMKTLDVERIHETNIVVNDDVESPWEVTGHGSRGAESAHIGADDAILPRKRRHPGIPGGAALGIAVQHQNRFRLE